MRTAAFLAALAVVPGITEAATAQRARYLMGTVCEVAVPAGHEAAIERAFAEAKRIESMLSTWTGDSELARVNRGEKPGAELRALLDDVSDWSAKTRRAFDPRVKALVDVWQLRAGGALPEREAIARAMQQSQVEEGAFGKGYAIDRMAALLPPGESMINFGGQIAVRGELRVTIADPENREHAVVAFTIRDASLSTSSGSEKTFAIDGRRFSHIVDPRSGEALPPRGSVSVIDDSALDADILSTALYVMGEDEGLRWADAHRVAAVFINPSHQIRLSERARGHMRGLELLDRRFSVKE